MAAKLDSSEKVLEWFPLAAALREVAQGGALPFPERPVELEIQVDAFLLAEDAGEEVLGVEAGMFNAVFGEIAGGGFEDIQGCHAVVMGQ